jgi:hypothetical protein
VTFAGVARLALAVEFISILFMMASLEGLGVFTA